MTDPTPATRSPTARLRSPLVGRKHELRMLEAALQETLDSGIAHTITVMGTPGVGKSRLVREFLADVRGRDDRVRVVVGQCRQDGAAYGVIRGILRARLGMVDGVERSEAEQHFRTTVTDIIGSRRVGEFLHFLGAFLDLQLPDSPLIQAMGDDPEQMRQVGRTVLRRFLEVDAAARPLVIVVENFQWAHEESLDLLRYLIGSLRDAPIMLINVARPELLHRFPDWMEAGGNALRFDLAPLDHEDAQAMVEHLLAPAGQLPDALLDAAVDLAGGNPYLIEQMVRTFIREGIVTPLAQGPWPMDLSRLDRATLPLSVDDAINARIESLEAAERCVLEMAAALGGVFWLGALVALERVDAIPGPFWAEAGEDRARIEETLDELIERDYLLRMPDSSIPGEAEYAFKHNLERESVHRYTVKSTLERYHLRIAQWLEFRLQDHTEEQCELLAHHYERGGATARAAHFYLLAGERAGRRFAAAQAAEYYERGLQLLGDQEVAVRLTTLGRHAAVLQLGGRTEDALQALQQMRALSFQLDLPERVAEAHAQMGLVNREAGHLEQAMRHLDTALALYEGAGDKRGVATTTDAVASVHAMRGNLNAAEHLSQDAIALLQEVGDERALAHSQNNLGMICKGAGRLPEAQVALERALTLWRALDDKRGIAESLILIGTLEGMRGEEASASRRFEEALNVTRASGDRMRQTTALTCLGSAAYRAGDASQAVKLLEEAERIAATVGDRMQEAATLRSLAKARAHVGDLPGALTDVARAIDLFERAEAAPQLGIALRTLGEIAAAGPAGADPEADPADAFERAVGIFQQTGNDPELARSYVAFADYLAQDAGERADGRERMQRAGRLRGRAKELLAGTPLADVQTSRIPRLL